MRPSWHEYFMLIAKLVSTRSTCNSRPTGRGAGEGQADPGHRLQRQHARRAPLPRGSSWPTAAPTATAGPKHRRPGQVQLLPGLPRRGQRHRPGGPARSPIKGAFLYVTLEPCYVCVKLLATAQIEGVFFEIPYESRDELRDVYWKEAVAEAGFKEYRQLTVSPEALETILPSLTGLTSTRRLPATQGSGKRHITGVVETD